MNATPLVSIVIPTMNRCGELIENMRHLAGQPLGNVEMIVVDDGSSDETPSTDFSAVDPRIRLICHGTNRGGSAARNTGIDAARGSLVAFLDSDDRWVPGKLERQLSWIAEIPQGTDYVLTSNVLTVLGDDMNPHNSRSPEPGEDMSAYLMIEGQALQTSTMILPTELARRVRFRDGLKRHQDWDFMLRLLQEGAELRYDSEPLAFYYLNPDPGRVSRQKGRLAATLAWYKLASDLVTERSMQGYFIKSALSRDGLVEWRSVLSGSAWLMTRHLVSAPAFIARAVARLAFLLRRKFAR